MNKEFLEGVLGTTYSCEFYMELANQQEQEVKKLIQKNHELKLKIINLERDLEKLRASMLRYTIKRNDYKLL